MNYPKPQILQAPTEGNKPRYIYVPEYKAKSFVLPKIWAEEDWYFRQYGIRAGESKSDKWKPSKIVTYLLIGIVGIFLLPIIIIKIINQSRK